jgi:hypothetical protein
MPRYRITLLPEAEPFIYAQPDAVQGVPNPRAGETGYYRNVVITVCETELEAREIARRASDKQSQLAAKLLDAPTPGVGDPRRYEISLVEELEEA